MDKQNAKHILVVEDEEDILELIRYNLVHEGFQVTGVTTGEAALQKLKSTTVDLLILDLMLPGMDGWEVCRALKSDTDTKSISILILSAKKKEEKLLKNFEIHPDNYITKPFSPKALIARVKKIL